MAEPAHQINLMLEEDSSIKVMQELIIIYHEVAFANT
jgi:hypothetical protein